MSANDDTDPMSPYGDLSQCHRAVTSVEVPVNCAGVDVLLVRARCCRDWPVLALTKMGHCGYCGQVPSVIGPW